MHFDQASNRTRRKSHLSSRDTRACKGCRKKSVYRVITVLVQDNGNCQIQGAKYIENPLARAEDLHVLVLRYRKVSHLHCGDVVGLEEVHGGFSHPLCEPQRLSRSGKPTTETGQPADHKRTDTNEGLYFPHQATLVDLTQLQMIQGIVEPFSGCSKPTNDNMAQPCCDIYHYSREHSCQGSGTIINRPLLYSSRPS